MRIDKELTSEVFEIGVSSRRANLSVDFDYLDRSVKAQMREANKLNARYVLFVGGEEYSKGQANLKNMSTGEQQLLNLSEKDSLAGMVKK